MPNSNMAAFNGNRGKRVGQTLKGAIPPEKGAVVEQLIHDTNQLRRLHDQDFRQFQRARDEWLQRTTSLTAPLDGSGIWTQVTDLAKNDLGDFSFADNGPDIAKALVVLQG